MSGEGDIRYAAANHFFFRTSCSPNYRSFHYPRFAKENLEDNAAVVEKFSSFAAVHRMQPAQLALAWLLKQGSDIIPIPGTKKVRYLKENCAAMEKSLSDGCESAVRQLVRDMPLHGMRTQENNAFSYTDTKEEA